MAGGHHGTAGSVEGTRSAMASTMTATPPRATGVARHGAGSVSSAAAGAAAASGGSQLRRSKASASGSSSSSMIERGGGGGGKPLSGASAGAGAQNKSGSRAALLTPSSLAPRHARTVAGGAVYRPPAGAGASGGWSSSGGAARAEPQAEAGLPPVEVSRWEMRRWEAVLLDLFRLSPPGSHVPSAEIGSRFKMRFGRKISEALKEVHPEFLMAHVLDKLGRGRQLQWNGKGGVDGRWWLPAERERPWGAPAPAAKGQGSGSTLGQGPAALGLAGEVGRRDQGGSGVEAGSGRRQGEVPSVAGSQVGSGRSALGSESGTEAGGSEARSPGDRSGRATAGGTGSSVTSAIGSNAGKG